jgi:hypothetical protein
MEGSNGDIFYGTISVSRNWEKPWQISIWLIFGLRFNAGWHEYETGSKLISYSHNFLFRGSVYSVPCVSLALLAFWTFPSSDTINQSTTGPSTAIKKTSSSRPNWVGTIQLKMSRSWSQKLCSGLEHCTMDKVQKTSIKLSAIHHHQNPSEWPMCIVYTPDWNMYLHFLCAIYIPPFFNY